MIFKTFDSDIDKISSKWGMFGHSFNDIFNDIGTAIVGRITDINKGFQVTYDLIGSIINSEGFFSRLSKNKEASDKWIRDSLGDIVTKDNITTYMPDLNDNAFSSILKNLVDIDTKVKSGSLSWQNYFNGLADGEKWQIKFVQNNHLQKASLFDVKKAYESARASALAHNEAIKAQTLSAKAGQAALKGLSIAGNMLVMWGISVVIQAAIKGIDKISHSAEYAEKAFKAATESARS